MISNPGATVAPNDFSESYDGKQAERYFSHHMKDWMKRLSNHREIAIARRALALSGNPGSVLDLPCGAGRFWAMLGEKTKRKILASDASSSMIETALRKLPTETTRRVNAFKGNAFGIQLEDNAVDAIFCMRFLHHLNNRDDRMALLKEFHRVTKNSVVVSLWVDGNFKAFRQKFKGESSRGRFVIRRQTIESEFLESGFAISGHFDLMRFYSMWRVYVLEKKHTSPLL